MSWTAWALPGLVTGLLAWAGAAALFGLVAALHAYFRTDLESAARTRARWFAAAAVTVALRPIQRVAEEFAGRVMDDVEDTPAYVRARKHSVYRAALEGTVEDGTISERERAILTRLSDELGISGGGRRTARGRGGDPSGPGGGPRRAGGLNSVGPADPTC